MTNIEIRHPDASTTLLVSKGRTSSVTKAEQTVALLGADTVAITVKTAAPITFYLGDQIEIYGKVYTLNQLPTIKKTGARKFEYNLTFEGVQYELIDAQWLLPADTVLDSFTGDLEDFIDILIGNINRVFPGKWVKGVFPADTEYKTLTFIGSNCLEVAQNLCSEYGIEFEIAQEAGIRTLNFKTAGVNFPYTFRYGRTGGLYELTRQNINSKNVVTRLYLYGGSNNLGSGYRYTKLCLSGKGKNASYIENAAAIAAFGLKENTKTFDDIYPNRYGVVSSLGSKYYAFVDNTMNFDLNEKESDGTTTKWLISGVNAKVKMTSGNLAGYEFEIHKYDHATKEIQVVPFTDENGHKFPSETSAAFQFGVDDKYIFTGINLPDAYKEEAEAKLQEEGETYYNQYCQPQVQYALSIDQNFIKQFGGNLTIVNLFAAGDYIQVEDADLGVNKSIRITAFTRDLLQPYKYSITLGDAVTKTVITRVIEDLQKIDTVIEINDLADPSKARRNWRTAQEVLANVFDPDGNYYSEKIRPLSIETTMLSVGARSQQFTLQDTRFEPNYNGNPNSLYVSGGTLIHYTIEETIRSWNINTGSFVFADNTARYIYARCERSGTACNIVIDTAQRTVDSNATYYYFLVGTLSSIITDSDGSNPARLISLTYGASTINGRFIKTGRIESADGTTYFDLDNGEIGGNIKFVASDGSAKNVSDLDSVAQETKDYINNTLPGILSGKRRVFVAQPYPPYDIGDLWVDGQDLRRCDTARASGPYIANDWVVAVNYDNTVTTINGGIVTSGTVQLAGSTSSILAGITGEGTAASSVRIWAGASTENRATAPFRVMQDGSVVMTKATVEGIINAISGTIGGFEIGSGRIGNVYGSDSGLALYNDFIRFLSPGSGRKYAAIGDLGTFGYDNLAHFDLSSDSTNDTLGSALFAKCRAGNGSMDYWYPQRAIEYDGNVYGSGKICNFEQGYIGQAYTDIITTQFHVTHKYHFTTNTTSLLGVDLPTKTAIDRQTNNKVVIFDIEIVCDHAMANTISVRSQAGAQIYDWDGNTLSYINMQKGDATSLRYYNGGYTIISKTWG